MQSTNRILDGFHAMSLATMRRAHLSPGERALLEFTAPERALLCDRICLVCQVVASSIMLEYPLTDTIPNITGVKDRLLGKIHQIRKQQAEMVERELEQRRSSLRNNDGEAPRHKEEEEMEEEDITASPISPTSRSPVRQRRRIPSPYAERSQSRGRRPAPPPPPPLTREMTSSAQTPGLDSALTDGGLVVVKERDYALLYIYTLLTAQVADELNKVLKEIEGLFGVLSEEALLLQ